MEIATIIAAVAGALVAYFLGLRSSRYERLEEKRAEVLAELSGLLFEVEDRYRKWYSPSLRGSHTMDEIRGKVKERGEAAIESLNAFTRCYHRNIAWLDPDIATRIDDSITEMQQMLFDYGRLGLGNTYFQLSEKGVEAAQTMESRIPEIKEELIREFRAILRPFDWWKRAFPWRIRMNPSQGSPPPQD